jgi:hypothetical protein
MALVDDGGKETPVGTSKAGKIHYFGGSVTPYIVAGYYTETVTFTTEKPGIWVIRVLGRATSGQDVELEERY